MLINEDTIRSRERWAAGQQLSRYIDDVITSHRRQGSGPGSRSKTLVSFTSVPSGSSHSGAGNMQVRASRTTDSIPAASAVAAYSRSSSGAAAFTSGPLRGWGAGEAHEQPWGAASRSVSGVGAHYGRDTGDYAAAGAHGPDTGRGHHPASSPHHPASQECWPVNPQSAAGGASPPAAGGASSGRAQPHAVPAADVRGDGSSDAHMDSMQHTSNGAAVGHPAGAQLASHSRANAQQQQQQQDLFKEAAAGGFRGLLRSVSPKRLFASQQAGSAVAGSLQCSGGGHGSLHSSPECSPTRSGGSFTARAAAKAVQELRPLPPAGQFSPLKASILAHS